jgi:two-component system cell cycle response regulator
MNEPVQPQSLRILIIEDDPASLELMRYLLDSYGYHVLMATRGDTGLELAIREHPDAIICDIQLPGRDGYAIARELRRQAAFADTPLIAMTAFAMVGDRERVMSAGFTTYVSKPIDPQSFVTRLARILGTSEDGRDRCPISTGAAPQAVPAFSQAILVVDDSPLDLELKRSIFEPLGYRVLTTDSVITAVELARSAQPCVIISDIQLAHQRGFELLGQLKADPALAHIPFVFIMPTNDNGAALRAQALELGPDRFILRPIEPAQLLQEIAACLVHDGGSRGIHPRHR